jgi:hypothetical protein
MKKFALSCLLVACCTLWHKRSAAPAGEPSAAQAPRPKLEAEPGQRRLRRTMHYTAANGMPATKCAALASACRMAALLLDLDLICMMCYARL